MWGETRGQCFEAGARNQISIHSPRVGRDFLARGSPASLRHFNPLSPCGERRGIFQGLVVPFQFQSTLPVWGETRCCDISVNISGDFNPLSPCGERRVLFLQMKDPCDFNPLSPCGERLIIMYLYFYYFNFNPLSPCGERRF